MRCACAVALTSVGLALTGHLAGRADMAAHGCALAVGSVARLSSRVDSLLAIGNSGAAVALTGPPTALTSFLPHDNLTMLTARGRIGWRLSLPPYITPPGLAASGDHPSTLYTVVDSALMLIDMRVGQIQTRMSLDVRALGWPATVTSGDGGRLYLVGQPSGTWPAVAEALRLSGALRDRVLWRAQLGFTHAGLWIGQAGPGRLVVYLPDAHDAGGSIAMLDSHTGVTQGGYAVPAPPLTADAASNRLFVALGGAIAAYTLDGGRLVGTTAGRPPLTLVPRRGLVVFAQGNGLSVASSISMHPMVHVALSGATALAATPDGTTLLAGLRGGLARVTLGSCAAA